MSVRDELPFRAEYAKTGRASCKSCKKQIQKEELRLAALVPSPFHEGVLTNWYHFDCFFQKRRPKSIAEFAHITSLRFEDQKRVEEEIGKLQGEVPANLKGKKRKEAEKQAEKMQFADFLAEYAKSGGSTCRLCEEKISKNALRLGKLDRDSKRAKMYGPMKQWWHVECFEKVREDLEFFASADKIPDFELLEEEDKKMLQKKFPSIKNSEVKKEAAENGEGPSNPKKRKKDETDLKKQSELIFGFVDNLKNLSKSELTQLFEKNHIDIPKGNDKMIERLADYLAFGKPESCPECKGQLVFRLFKYICTGNASEWLKCQYECEKPKRNPMKITKELKEQHDFLRKYKYVVRNRIMDEKLKAAAIASKAAEEAGSSNSIPKVKSETKEENGVELILNKHRIVSVGRLSITKKILEKKLTGFGAKLVPEVDRTVLCVITTQKELDKNEEKRNGNLLEAEELNIPVVSEGFITACEDKVNPIQGLKQTLISSWGDDVEARFNKLTNVKEKMKSGWSLTESELAKEKEKSGKSIQKMVVKDGFAVDPESGLEDKAHIYKEGKLVYNAILNKVDLLQNKNSYYKIQLLQHDNKQGKFWVFRSWGRIGTDRGSTTLHEFRSIEEAKKEFCDVYFDKTENDFSSSSFVKQAHLYYPIEVDYGVKQEEALVPLNSKLPKPVQDLICLIFDVEQMKQAMMEFELDLEKMPLGKLSKNQILNAYSVLKDLSSLIESKSVKPNQVLEASTKFYTLLPHDFGEQKPPLIDNEELLKTKLEMLDSLLEIETAYEIITDTRKDSDVDPVDQHYEKLNTEITPLEKQSEEFETIEKYVKNTHAATHSYYTLEIEEVFKVSRKEEAARYKKDLHNKMLLWHGSRLTNFAGILSQGLRIAPPEAPVTGYMFGKGIYFADMVSKSANYCYHSMSKNTGLILLSEVALGDTWDLKDAKHVTELPKGKHSVKGVGKTIPDPKGYVVRDDVTIPCGEGVTTKVKQSSLLYNEYIVYDVSQVNIKYLLKLKFNNKY